MLDYIDYRPLTLLRNRMLLVWKRQHFANFYATFIYNRHCFVTLINL